MRIIVTSDTPHMDRPEEQRECVKEMRFDEKAFVSIMMYTVPEKLQQNSSPNLKKPVKTTYYDHIRHKNVTNYCWYDAAAVMDTYREVTREMNSYRLNLTKLAAIAVALSLLEARDFRVASTHTYVMPIPVKGIGVTIYVDPLVLLKRGRICRHVVVTPETPTLPNIAFENCIKRGCSCGAREFICQEIIRFYRENPIST